MNDVIKVMTLLEKLDFEVIDDIDFEDKESAKNISHTIYLKEVGKDEYSMEVNNVIGDDGDFTGEIFAIRGTKNEEELFFGLNTYEAFLKELRKDEKLKAEMLKDEELRMEIQFRKDYPR